MLHFSIAYSSAVAIKLKVLNFVHRILRNMMPKIID